MKLLPRSVTITGLFVALSALLLDQTMAPVFRSLFGEHFATIAAGIGALLAALGRALIPPTADPAAAAQEAPPAPPSP